MLKLPGLDEYQGKYQLCTGMRVEPTRLALVCVEALFLGSVSPWNLTLPETNMAPENGWLEY